MTEGTPLAGRVAIVTGGGRGLGRAMTLGLANAGAAVLATASREPGEIESLSAAAPQGRILPVIADVTREDDCARAVATALKRFGRLDILVNNAGIAAPGDGPPTATTLDAIERALRVNFMGSVAVTQAMLPLLRKAPSARIVNVSSGLGSLTQNGDPAWPHAAAKFLGYSASKAALNMLTVQLAYELRGTTIKVNSADPGYTATDLNGHRGTQSIPEGAAEAIRLALLPDDGPTGTYSDKNGIVPW
jgi:NAD(P)-dependent dehydrogenase (short-subunit alcohol dehydrogenase family)